MPILSARYIKDGVVKEYDKREITSQLYSSTLKGFLYCPTAGCNARVVFNSGLKSFLRTWSFDNHAEDCIHGFERTKGRVGVDTSTFINIQLSDERKKRALKEALKRYNMSNEELEQEKQKRANRKSNPKTTGKKVVPTSIAVIQGGDNAEGGSGVSFRGPNLSKRTADMLKDIDTGKPRLIMGKIKSITLLEDVADIIVVENGIEICIKFEDAFKANSPEYLGLFYHISDYMSEVSPTKVIFTVIGEVRKVNETFEVSVFYGQDFEMDGMNLRQLAVRNIF
ncbi:MAG TPA: hypothetical protein VNM45_14920 [Bacillus sp. (in: firmicutes)]|nr:hypothetical protein [Bacillus sp. (in: firmicutes)]